MITSNFKHLIQPEAAWGSRVLDQSAAQESEGTSGPTCPVSVLKAPAPEGTDPAWTRLPGTIIDAVAASDTPAIRTAAASRS